MRGMFFYNIRKNIISYLILLWPPINIWFAYFLKGENLLTLYIVYSMLIILFCVIRKSTKKVKIETLFILLMLVLVCSLHLILEISEPTVLLTFTLCVILWIVFSNRDFQEDFKKFLFNKNYFVYFVETIFLVGLLMSALYGDGILEGGWGTTTLKGPYLINHLLAYELLAFLILDLVYWANDGKSIHLVFSGVFAVLIVLTGVRSALLAALLAYLFAFRTKDIKKKFVVLILGVFLFLFLFFETTLFSGLIEKTEFAISLGSASNGRGKIFVSSIKALTDRGFSSDWITGIGQEALFMYNRNNIRQTIHAHNDFINALVQYGIFGLSVFLMALRKLVRREWVAFLLIFILAFFNGFYMYQSIVVMTPIIITFSDTVKVVMKREKDLN